MLTKTAVAKRLGVTIATVTDWIDTSALRAVDVSRDGSTPRWRITEESLSDFLESRSSLSRKHRPSLTRRRKVL